MPLPIGDQILPIAQTPDLSSNLFSRGVKCPVHEEHVEVQFERSSTLPIIILVSLTKMISPYSCNQLSLFECRQNPNNSA